MKKFIVEHNIVKGGWFLNGKLQYVRGIENAYIWEDEEEFYIIANSPIGRCKTTIREKMYKFVAAKTS